MSRVTRLELEKVVDDLLVTNRNWRAGTDHDGTKWSEACDAWVDIKHKISKEGLDP